ncbi:malto-oligosyltrehalose synthase [Niveibacterium sp. SC-1]|uniref:malto-oligosyltrehalose synthase n=1 Tax=Niveibacterium sp. SC-1 TaxID=3135646 RepID=UPI00311F1831
MNAPLPLNPFMPSPSRAPATPLATYRLQLRGDFGFDHALAQLDYFQRLGISHLYTSPISTARPGSTHGYDVIDPTRVNPELGGEDGLRRLVAGLRQRGMGLVIDHVPNHMAVGGIENPWWSDVLEWGARSPCAEYFDIDFDAVEPQLAGKLLAPFLGSSYGQALAAAELQLLFEAERGGFLIGYFDQRFPLDPLRLGVALRGAGEAGHEWAKNWAGRFDALARIDTIEAQRKAAAELRTQFAKDGTGLALPLVQAVLAAHDTREADGRARLHALLEMQHYRLADWRCAADEINWRRFFDINALAGLRVERPEVFEATHALLFRLYAQGLVDGVRIDHVDGLSDPADYCRLLRRRLDALAIRRPEGLENGRAWIVVEKILASRERLPQDWNVDGTTGYDFMNEVADLLHDPDGEAPLTAGWLRACAAPADVGDFATLARDARRKILAENFAAALDACASAFHDVALASLATRDITRHAIRRALVELIAYFPVYRSYFRASGGRDTDGSSLAEAWEGARRSLRSVDRPALDAVVAWIGEPFAHTDALRDRALRRFQQLTSPVAAKAVEDTALYRYGRLLSANTVGGDPTRFSLEPAEFHARVQTRQAEHPHALLATATHDHKRGEDARARLSVLSEIPQQALTILDEWVSLNSAARQLVNGRAVPSAASELMLYQTLVGSWPLTLAPDDVRGVRDYAFRILAWTEKAQREAKVHTDWFAPDIEYEAATRRFVESLLQPGGEFVRRVARVARDLAPAAAINGLTQTVLRCTLPGVPDLYQGTEYWDLSLVDPDNRRPVDYAARRQSLDALLAMPAAEAVRQALAGWREGHLKQWVIARLLDLRQREPALFGEGSYRPLEVVGPAAPHVLAFARCLGAQSVIVACARLPRRLAGMSDRPLIPPTAWAGSMLQLPEELAVTALASELDGMQLHPERGGLPFAALFDTLPVAVLRPVFNKKG